MQTLNSALNTLPANLVVILIVGAVWEIIMKKTEKLDGQDRYKERTTFRKIGRPLNEKIIEKRDS